MSTKSLIIATIGAGCIAAAGAGGFLAQRMNGAGVSADAPEAAAARALADAPLPEKLTAYPARSEPTSPPAAAVAPPATARETRPVRAPTPTPRTPSPAPAPAPAETVVAPAAEPVVVSEPVMALPAPPPEPAPLPERPEYVEPRFIETTVAEDAVIGIRLETAVSSETAKVEDRVVARVTRDVIVDGRTAIPAGAQLEGVVTEVDRGGRFKERARLGLRFNRLILSENSTSRIETETILREGESPSGEATSKIGASAVIGAILGGVIGGKKGAAIGGSAGAAGGTAAVAAGGRNDAELAEGTPLTVRLTRPVTLLIERQFQRH
jgi:hypothetical protein